MAKLTPERQNQILAVAKKVEGGDLAILKALLEYEDILAEFKSKIDSSIEEYKSLSDEERSKLAENTDKISSNYNRVIELINEKEDNLNQMILEVRKDSEVDIKNISERFAQELNSVRALIPAMPEMPNLENLENKLVSEFSARLIELSNKIPTIEIQTPVIIRDKLETLKGDDRLDKSAIKGLEDEFKTIDEKISKAGTRIIGGSRSNNSTQFYDLSAQTNGSKKIFSVPKSKAAIVLCSDFPSVLMENNGFTLNASRTQLTLTITNAPSQGSQLLYQFTSIFNL